MKKIIFLLIVSATIAHFANAASDTAKGAIIAHQITLADV